MTQNKTLAQTWNQWIIVFTSILTIVHGFTALLGRQIPYLTIIQQIEPTYFAMVYDTSFCFFIAGIALFATFLQRYYIVKILIIVLMSICILTIVQYVLGVEWNITQHLFIYFDIKSEYFNKTRPINVVCFMATGLVLWNMSEHGIPTRRAILLTSWIGALLPALAILCLFGYVIHTDNTYADGWGLLAPMSINAAIGFILLGVGITSLAADFSQRVGVDLKKSSPILIAVFVSLVSLLFWRLLITRQHLRDLPPDLAIIAIVKELGISLLVGVAIYFLQTARYHAKNAEQLLAFVKQAETKLLYQATHDVLTGLANRFLLLDHIQQATAHAKRQGSSVALLFFDLDHFKPINDSLGHAIGDELLKAVATRLTALTRQEDTLARLGGDEFVLLVLDVNEENVITIVEKYSSEIAKPFYIESHELYLGCSIGISLYPKDGMDADILLANADIAMYRAKKNNQWFQFYTTQIQQDVMTRLSIENELRHALEKNEFVLYYQPVIDLHTRKICAAEALIRWQNPLRGLMNPADFIPIAEEIGIIVPIGEWALHTACAQNSYWQKNGLLTACICVNVTEEQIKQPNFYDLIDHVLKKASLDPEYLILELTENTLMEDVTITLKQLNKKGVKLSIDDFGKEYSNLSRLKHFPMSKLKIDKSFLKDCPADPDDRAIVLAIIAMAKNLNMRVVSEGVETKEQLEFLGANGCDEVQGYYFAKPLPPSEFEAFITELNTKIIEEFSI